MGKKQNGLYAYFGYLGMFNTDIPGHTFYQVGLIDQLCISHDLAKVDFYSYLSNDNIENTLTKPVYPEIGNFNIFKKFTEKRILGYNLGFNQVLSNIKKGKYSKIFLKARFRNLSTLTKGLTDAAQFEQIIRTACENGMADRVIILDTDLSLTQEFIDYCKDLGIKFEIPSIDYPNVSIPFLEDCANHWVEDLNRFNAINNIFYYGNISFGNYKQGHAKNPILTDALLTILGFRSFTNKKYDLQVAGKLDANIEQLLSDSTLIKRWQREDIWKAYSSASLSLNISKDLYIERGFIPARVYESLIFGAIPISFKDARIHPALKFNSLHELAEVLAFFKDTTQAERKSIYLNCVSSIIRMG